VLPAASPGTISMVPDRLAGWWLASFAGTAAVLMLSPRRGKDNLRAAASKLAAALGDQLDAALRGAASEDQLTVLSAAKYDLFAQFTATPYRPTGLTPPDEALANLVELLEWCTALVSDMVRERTDLRDASADERALLESADAVLRDVASLLAGGDAHPDVGCLERIQADSLASLAQRAAERTDARQDARISFHAHTIAVAVRASAIEALVAARRADPNSVAAGRRRQDGESTLASRTPRRVSNIVAAAREQASVRSVWFVNSLRGAIALAVAVAVADLSSVQHGFWVVLGTLSVLRTNASATGSIAWRALLGTAIGFVIGGAFLLAIGSDSSALWVALPIAVFVAAYTPGTAPFAIGQAAFTVTIAVLFNLLMPVGWKVGVLRIEDVALGCGVSIAVGALFWPRGVSAVVGDDLADAFRSGASYLTQAVEWASGSRAVKPDSAMAANAAASRLDDALRSYLAEQGTKRIQMQELWRLVGGSLRLRLTAHGVASLPHDATGVAGARAALGHRAKTLAAWYERLAEMLGRPRGRTVETLDAPTFGTGDVVEGSSVSHYVVWLCEHLDHLAEHTGELLAPAMRIAEMRRAPWWQ
jgi:hypothetical protein